MGGPRQRRKWSGGAFYALALLALLFKVYVPTGFMVGDGGTVVICTGMGPMKMADTHREAPAAPDKHKADHACPFASNGAPPLAHPMVAALVAPMMLETRTDSVALNVAPGRGLAAPPPPSTGPPLLLA